MTKKVEKSKMGKLADHSVRALMELTDCHNLVLMQEDDMYLFLIPTLMPNGKILYNICDDLHGRRSRELTFINLTDAIEEYHKIRKAGSWKDYLDNLKDKKA